MGACWVELCGKRGVPLNSDKRQRCRQRVKYAGFLFDTLRGQLPIVANVPGRPGLEEDRDSCPTVALSTDSDGRLVSEPAAGAGFPRHYVGCGTRQHVPGVLRDSEQGEPGGEMSAKGTQPIRRHSGCCLIFDDPRVVAPIPPDGARGCWATPRRCSGRSGFPRNGMDPVHTRRCQTASRLVRTIPLHPASGLVV